MQFKHVHKLYKLVFQNQIIKNTFEYNNHKDKYSEIKNDSIYVNNTNKK